MIMIMYDVVIYENIYFGLGVCVRVLIFVLLVLACSSVEVGLYVI